MATEKRLTDANALLAEVVKAQALEPDKAIAKIITLLTEAESVDAVEVVRCNDCKQWGGVVYGGRCKQWSAPLSGMTYYTSADDFCSYGERRTDA